MFSERQVAGFKTANHALISDKQILNMQLCISLASQKDERRQTLSAVNSHQCQKALAHCSLDVDKQLLTVIDSSAISLPQSDASSGRAAKQLVFIKLND